MFGGIVIALYLGLSPAPPTPKPLTAFASGRLVVPTPRPTPDLFDRLRFECEGRWREEIGIAHCQGACISRDFTEGEKNSFVYGCVLARIAEEKSP